ncbi:MAG: glycosyltransferase, partial [Actinobacteria bacterium]|nr:glycosyltransferase [Actinomycetota bacterium]
NQQGVGVRNAILAGVKEAVGKYILIAPIDEIAPLIAIPDMIYLMDHGCDLVSGTRYGYGGRRLGGSFIGKTLSRVANKLYYSLSGSGISDTTTGLKMFRKQIFNKIKLESETGGWAVLFELAVKAQIGGFKLGEVPATSIDRLYGGKSTFSLKLWTGEYFKWFVWGVKHSLIKRRGIKPLVRIPAGTIR